MRHVASGGSRDVREVSIQHLQGLVGLSIFIATG